MPDVKTFKNLHKGERCFIVVTGPSINKTNLSLIKDEILFGVNQLYESYDRLGIDCQYYAVADHRILITFKKGLEKLNTILFLVQSAASYYKKNREQFQFVKEPYVVPNIPGSGFSTDFSVGCHWGSTVTFDACMQATYYMGFDEVYIVGLDCDYFGATEHFDNKAWSWREKNTVSLFKKQFSCFDKCRKAFEKDGRKFINATVGGKCEVFERMSLEEVFGG